MDGLLLDALYSKYRADKADAVARLNIYLSNHQLIQRVFRF